MIKMGKNNGKHAARTAFAKWTSVMRKLQNELDEEKKTKKPSKTDNKK